MKFLSVFLLFVITACGFTPVYGVKSPDDRLQSIDIAVIANREGQIVRNHLIDTLYRNGQSMSPLYKLSVDSITEKTVEIGIDKDDEASRAQLRLETTMRLYNVESNRLLFERTVRTTTGYNILAGQFTTYITEQDAREQGLKALADQIITQLELHFNR